VNSLSIVASHTKAHRNRTGFKAVNIRQPKGFSVDDELLCDGEAIG
jgi:hypothetical protein